MVFLPPGGQCWEKCLPRTLRSSVLISAGTTWVCVPDSCPEYIRIGYVNTRVYTVHYKSLCFVQVQHSHPFTLLYSHALAHCLSLSLCHACAPCHFHSHTHMHTWSLSPTHTLSLSPTHTCTLCHTQSHKPCHTLASFHIHTLSL